MKRRSLHARNSSTAATISSERSMGEVGDGVWAAVETPVVGEAPTTGFFEVASSVGSMSVQLSGVEVVEDEIVIVEDGTTPMSSVTRFGYSPPPVKHSVPTTIFLASIPSNDPPPSFTRDPQDPTPPTALLNEERDPPLRIDSLSGRKMSARHALSPERREGARVAPSERSARSREAVTLEQRMERQAMSPEGVRQAMSPDRKTSPRQPISPDRRSSPQAGEDAISPRRATDTVNAMPMKPSPTASSAKKDSFAQTMRSPDLYASFKAFTTSEHCSENLTFLEHLTSLDRKRGQEETPLAASRTLDRFLGLESQATDVQFTEIPLYVHLYSTFIREGAPLELNIPDSVRRDIKAWVLAWQSGESMVGSDSTLFDLAADEVIRMVYRDVFPRFLVRAAPVKAEEEERGRRRAGSLGGGRVTGGGRERSKSQGRFAWLNRFIE
ncbi:hypothetical protein HDU67_001060 [Dinochytrium kinnereticum]|nr:hypothetical protein HDU67_001060 [Dinochytrium kinnereticum]